MSKVDFKYLSQGFHNDVLDLIKQKRFYRYEYMSDFEKFKKELFKEEFYSSVTDRETTDKKYDCILYSIYCICLK